MKVAQVLHVARVDRLYPYAERMEECTEEAIRRKMDYIQKHGFSEPMVIDPFGSILSGTCEFLAARRLGVAAVPVIVVDTLATSAEPITPCHCPTCGHMHAVPIVH